MAAVDAGLYKTLQPRSAPLTVPQDISQTHLDGDKSGMDLQAFMVLSSSLSASCDDQRSRATEVFPLFPSLRYPPPGPDRQPYIILSLAPTLTTPSPVHHNMDCQSTRPGEGRVQVA